MAALAPGLKTDSKRMPKTDGAALGVERTENNKGLIAEVAVPF